MLAAARHDVLVIADSDVHAASYLGDRVEWRGHSLRVAAPGLAAPSLRIGQAP